ncbi:lysophospholipid acyltransferase family protein [Chloroflexota bacterium]
MSLYYTFKILEATLARLPKRLSYMLACFLATVVFRAMPSLRRTVTSNVSHVIGPVAKSSVIDSTVRGVLNSTFKNYFDIIRLPRLSRDNMLRMINVTGLHHLDKAVKKGNGVILFTAHLGSFDTAFQILGTLPTVITVVVEPINPPVLLNYISKLRAEFGLNILPAKSGALRQIIKLLRKGEVLLFVLDRDTAGARVKSSFFGEETSMPAEAVKIAMRTGASIVPTFNNRRSDGNYDLYVEPEIDIARNGNGSLEKNMAQIANVMEKYIRRFPEQWVVLEPIWDNN